MPLHPNLTPIAGLVGTWRGLPTGQSELAEGPLTIEANGFSSELGSRVVNSGSATVVDTTERRLHLAGDELRIEFAMAAVGVPLTHHLSSVLQRQQG